MRQVTEFMPDIDLNDVIKALGNPVRRKNSAYAQEPKIHFHQPYADADEFGVCVSIIQERSGSHSLPFLFTSQLFNGHNLLLLSASVPGRTTNVTMIK